MATTCYFKFYDLGIKNLKLADILTHDIRVGLCTSSYSPNSATHQYYDVSITNELTTAYGYTVGGQALTNKTVNDPLLAGQYIVLSDNPQWTATGGDIVAHLMFLYDNTPSSNKPLIGYGYLDWNGGTPQDVTCVNGLPLTIVLPTLGFFSTLKDD